MRAVLAGLAALVAVPASGEERPSAGAVEPSPDAAEDGPEQDRPARGRFELAPFPSLGGNTDIGFLFGVNVAVARLEPGFSPYRYRIHAVAEVSVKDGPDGVELPAHCYVADLDLPGLLGGRLRVTTQAGYRRIINAGYFGLAGLSGADPESRLDLGGGRRYQYVRQEPLAGIDLRWALAGTPFEILAGAGFRYVLPRAYPGSLLEEDLARLRPDRTPVVRAVEDHALVELRTGLLWDSRDHEIAPTTGAMVETSLRGGLTAAELEARGFGGLTVDLRHFRPLLRGQRLVLATRLALDLLFGDVPFYELSEMGTFHRHGFASSEGVRGSPDGRHFGEAKVLGVVELRSLFVPFRLFRMPMVFGMLVHLTVGASWATLAPERPLSGVGPAATFGAGGGLLLRWGEAVVVRIEVDYSPDSTDGGDPVGVYFNLGYAF